ncbi:MAG: peptidyl-prolyl cis-trans isomerase, partial [Planctomycetes bacterium]|nr:peptidyl-prolyl cis-trans isomerase [Planctomycetota bacterium]
MNGETNKIQPKLELPSRDAWGLKTERRRSGWPTLVLGALLGVVLALQIYSLGQSGRKGEPAAESSSTAPAKVLVLGVPAKDLAARLQRINLPSAAAKVIEEHLQALGPEKADERKKTLVTLGNLLFKAGRYEEAIVRYYQAESLQVDAETQAHIDRQVKECLEKLGRHNELAYELADRASPGRQPGSPVGPGEQAAGKVVARIGVEPITASDLEALIAKEVDRQLAALPGLDPQDRENYRAGILKEFQAPQRRLKMLQELVARKVLYREGMERELDRSSAVQEEIDNVRENLIAQQVVLEAMAKQIKISEGDLRLFFQAEGSRYMKKASAQARVAVFADEKTAQEALGGIKSEEDFIKAAKEGSVEESTRQGGGLLSAPVVDGEPIPVFGDEPALRAAILEAAPSSAIAKPVALKKGFAIAYVQEKTAARQPSFQEAREEVARDYTRRKQMEVQQQLLAELFKKHAATVHTEAFLQPSREGSGEQG